MPPSKDARRELDRQLATGRRVECNGGGGLRLTADNDRLCLTDQRARTTATAGFSYTLQAPGEAALHAIGRRILVRRQPIAEWMFTGAADRAALSFRADAILEMRTRRPGDRLRPLGGGRKRLKSLLIDRRIPRSERDLLPLLVIDGAIAWVPGVAIDESFRVQPDATDAWIATIVDLEPKDLLPTRRTLSGEPPSPPPGDATKGTPR
ncbi:MAG: tRNA lysidine(34) synthetase TilS [Acidobacteriota bacterium]